MRRQSARKVNPRDEVLKSAARHLTFRRAALVAISSLEQSILRPQDVKQVVKRSTQLLQLQLACVAAETEFLDAMSELSTDDKEYIIMKLMDRDGDGKINLRELSIAFHKMDSTQAYSKSVEDAHAAIQKADTDKDGMMNQAELRSFLNWLLVALECSFDELCFMLVQWLAFNDTGHDIIQEAMEDNNIGANERKADLSDFDDEVTETRIALLFQNLDYNGTGKVLFLDVFQRLFEVIKEMNPNSRNLLFMMDSTDKTRELDYDEFTNLLFNVTAACPLNTHFHDIHDIMDAMTVSGAFPGKAQSKEMTNLLTSVEIDKALDFRTSKELRGGKRLSHLTYGRMKNLFRMSDSAGTGFIEADEMVISIRKLTGASKDIDATIEDAVAIIAHVDEDHDQRLSFEEYASLLVTLATALETDVNELVSYLAVELALRDHDEKEKAYIKKMKRRLVRKVKAKQLGSSSSSSTWSWFNGLMMASKQALDVEACR